MKVYFLNPTRYHARICDDFLISFNISRFSRGVDIVYGVTPPTELALLAAVVEKKHSIKILDANALNLLPREVFKWIFDNKPDYLVIKVGDSTLLDDLAFYYYAEGLGIKTIVWEDILNPFYSEKLQQDLNIKRIMWGEPEETIFKFLEGAEGVIGGGIIRNLDQLPIPNMEQLPMTRYLKEGKRNWYMFLHRGCEWGKCRFCLMESKSITFRKRSCAHIKKELDVLKKYNIDTIYFWDPQINPSKERILEISDVMAGYDFRWECWMRADIVDHEIVSCMKKSGCFRIHIGVESGHQRVLDNINKGTTPKMILNAFNLVNKFKIESVAYLCLGTIEEGHDSFKATINLLKKINPTTIVPSGFRPFPGVSLVQEMKEKNMLVKDHYQLALAGKCFGKINVSNSNFLTSDEINTYIKKIHRLSTITAIISYLKKPRLWKSLIKVFFIRSIRNMRT